MEGHAHGLYKESDDSYLFLDANFGVFRYRRARISEAMSYLWIDGGDEKIGYYPETKTFPVGQYTYITFGKA